MWTSEEIQHISRSASDFVYFTNNIFSKSTKTFVGGNFIDDTCRFLSQNKNTIMVSGRGHAKSFLFYSYFMYRLMFDGASENMENHYFSFNENLAGYHIGKIKNCIKENLYFRDIIDAKPTAENVAKYSWDGKHFFTIFPHGLTSFSRGTHTSGIIAVDDPFQDPDNELNLATIFKINDVMRSNIMSMPVGDGVIKIVGCLLPTSKIPIYNKGIIELKDVKVGDEVFSINEKEEIIKKKVTHLVDNGEQPCLKIETGFNKISATYNHPFYTREGWKEAGDLKIGEYVAIPKKIPFGNTDYNPDELKLIGYLIGGKSYTKNGIVTFFNTNKRILENIENTCKKLGIDIKKYQSDKIIKNIKSKKDCYRLLLHGDKMRNILKKYNIKEATSKNKKIPFNIFKLTKTSIMSLMVGLYDTNGSAQSRNTSYYTTSEELAIQIKYLLNMLGFTSFIRKRNNIGVTEKPTIYQINISFRKDGVLFYNDLIKFGFCKKTIINNNNIPKDERISLLEKENYLAWSKIKKITDIGKQKTLNLTIDGGNFIADGFITHNTAQSNEDFFFDPIFTKRFSVKILPSRFKDENGIDRALWPEWMDLKELNLKEEELTPRVFSREYLCTPVMSTKSFFDRDYFIKKCVNENLVLVSPYKFRPTSNLVVGAWDLGKKQHPAHFVVFEKQEDKIVMLHHKFMDGWDYTNGKKFDIKKPSQLEYINMCIDNLNIKTVHYDNTRGELIALDEQGLLTREFVPVIFNSKTKLSMATAASKTVDRRQLVIPKDDRYINQICCVNSELQAMETKEGHGEAFVTLSLALMGVPEIVASQDPEMGIKTRKLIKTGVPSIFSLDKIPDGF